VAVLAVAGIAAYVSYWHAYAVVRAHGETGITARLEPTTIDGLVYASSMVVLYAARHRVPVPSLARWLLGLGIAASTRLAAEEERARQAHDQLAAATTAHAAETGRIRREAQERIAAAETDREHAVQAAEAARNAAVTEAAGRRQDAQQAGQRAAVAEARAETAAAETARVRDDAARELGQLRTSAAAELDRLRADTARERDDLRELLEDRASTLAEASDAQRRRAERAEADLDAARAELTQLRSKSATTDAPSVPRRRRGDQSPQGWAGSARVAALDADMEGRIHIRCRRIMARHRTARLAGEVQVPVVHPIAA
jgi:hypothetical protein